jgi:transcriptional regulator with XRE-family HTH domain
MTQTAESDEFAACLRALKERAKLSYETLAQKTGISSSSLHRYCSGSYVPQDYGPAHRFAAACGASPEELRRLHRLWALADASRGSVQSPESEPEPEPQPELATNLEPVLLAAGDLTRRRRKPLVLGGAALVLALGTVWAALGTTDVLGGTGGGEQDGRLLFSKACAQPVNLGQHDACVGEVQRLLARAGAVIGVDSEFGPQTLRRVTAFQVLSGISPNGVVGDETKKALYEPKVRMTTWKPDRVRKRVREVFSEEPDHAVAIADCQSLLDPLHILPNTNGTRNWGLFQISDARLRELGGTPRKALDPEWNIQAAYRLWKRAKDFGDWPYCDRAYQNSPSASPSASASASPSIGA